MVLTDENKGHAKTSLSMTRSMAEDIGLKVRSVCEQATDETIQFTFTEWLEFFSQCWNDKIWIRAINIAISDAQDARINLNKNHPFLVLVRQKSFVELKLEMENTHPIAKMALKDNIGKKTPEPQKERKYSDLWLSPKELKEMGK